MGNAEFKLTLYRATFGALAGLAAAGSMMVGFAAGGYLAENLLCPLFDDSWPFIPSLILGVSGCYFIYYQGIKYCVSVFEKRTGIILREKRQLKIQPIEIPQHIINAQPSDSARLKSSEAKTERLSVSENISQTISSPAPSYNSPPKTKVVTKCGGCIYCLSNNAMPGLYKIGYTKGSPYKRALDLYKGRNGTGTGVPAPFKVVFYCFCESPYEAEQKLHKILHAYRFNHNREFFQIEYEKLELITKTNLPSPSRFAYGSKEDQQKFTIPDSPLGIFFALFNSI